MMSAWMAGLLLAAGPALAGWPSDWEASGRAWGSAPGWSDGLAEVAEYETVRPRYGIPRRFRQTLITVREDFDAAQLVKADPPLQGRGILPVFKLNVIADFRTDAYTYHWMTSVFVRQHAPFEPVKLSFGSQEWCGNGFTVVAPAWGRARLRGFTYFDGRAETTQTLSVEPGDLYEDQLAVSLRALPFRAGAAWPVRIVGTVAGNQGRPLSITPAEVRVLEEDTVDVPAGHLRVWRVEVRPRDVWGESGDAVDGGLGGRREPLRFWFDVRRPHPLVKFEAPDGRAMALVKVERTAYWRHPAPPRGEGAYW